MDPTELTGRLGIGTETRTDADAQGSAHHPASCRATDLARYILATKRTETGILQLAKGLQIQTTEETYGPCPTATD